MMNVRLSLASTSTIALMLGAIALPASASAQTESTQVATQEANDATKCADVTDAAQRQECLDRKGDTALPVSGAPTDEEIVVTGSRISRPNFETLQPSVVIDSAQIESRGFETLGQAINEQPSFGVPGASPVGAAQGGSFGSGQSFVNFLGLGDQRTLTLVNSRRFVSSNTASIFGPTGAGSQVDLNAINTKLVERVETIAIGGAPIYGSDAIAGTVNVILKRNYEGFDIDAQYGISQRGDAPNYRIRGLGGMNFADGRGNVTVSAEYNKAEGLVYNDRAITRRSDFYGDCPPGSQFSQCLYPDRRIPSISENGIPTVGGDVFGLNFPFSQAQSDYFGLPTCCGINNFGVLDVNGNQLSFTPEGQLNPIIFGNPVGDPTNSFNIDFSGGNGFNIANVLQLLTDTKRYNANLITQFEVSDKLRLFGEGWYSYSKGTNLRAQPVYNSGLFDDGGTPDGPVILDINNPFLTSAQRNTIQASINNNPGSDQNVFCSFFGECDFVQDYFYLNRANTDIVSGRATSETKLYRFVAGADGKFDVLGRTLNWELVGNYGRSKTKGREPVLVQQNFENAVNAVLDGSGNIVCAPGAVNASIPTLSSTCAPLNLFGNGRGSQAALDYITAIADPTGINKQYVVTASIAGPIVKLPGGDLSFALGYEHRKESTSFKPGAFYFGGDDPNPLVDSNGDGIVDNDRVQFGRSIPIFPVKGSFNTDEFFGELRAQIISPSNSVPGIRSLELHGAARHVDNSIAGSDWTYTVEGRWGIIKDIAVRANYTRAIRAPAITEVFNPSSQFFGFATDPCDGAQQNQGPDPTTRAANCAAAGVPANFSSRSNQRSFSQAIAGNVALENERSRAYSVGVVLNPQFIPGLTLSADYIDIKLTKAISSFSASQVAAACYDSPDFLASPFCDLVERGADDQLSFIETSYFNAADFRYRGVLGSLDYRTRTPFLGAKSEVGVSVSYQYLRTLETRTDANSAPAQLDGGIGYPKHSAVFNVNYKNGVFGAFTSVNYTGKVEVDPQAPKNTYDFPNRKAVAFVNSGVSFDLDRMTLRLIVDNVFDTKPPYPSPANGGAVSYFPGILGRYFRAGASIKF